MNGIIELFTSASWPWGLESKVTFTQDIPSKRVHEY